MQARPFHAAAPSWEDAEGVETSREALLVGVRRCSRASGFWGTRDSRQRLGAWAASEEEPKPRRGFGNHSIVSRDPEREYPVVQPVRAKDMTGASKQWRR